MPMKRVVWLMCYRGVRKHTYKQALEGRLQARYTLLHDTIGSIMCGSAFQVFFAGNKIKAAMQRNMREKRLRKHHVRLVKVYIMQHVLGNYGPDRLFELLPYMNGYKLPAP